MAQAKLSGNTIRVGWKIAELRKNLACVGAGIPDDGRLNEFSRLC